VIVRCPQCGTEFDKDANEFCPNPACGYPSAFILAPEADEEQPDDMTRRPGEQATAPQPVIPTTPPAPPPGPSPSPTLVEPVPVAPAAPPPRRRQPPLIALIGIGFAIGVVIILLVVLLTRGGGGPEASPGGTTSPGTTGASPAVTPECTTAFFQGSLGERVLGPCQAAMRGTDVQQLQSQLNKVLVGQRVLATDGSFGPRTATAVADYQRCRGIKPANSIVDTETANRIAHETAVDACPTSLPDLGPPHPPSPSPKASPSPSPSPSPTESPSPTPTDTLPTTT